jgi:uncharacterized protein
MLIEIGQVEAIFRYPVKSMGGERLEVANLGWHGLDGDRRLAFRRIDDRSGFPWLTATKLPDLLLFSPLRREDGAEGDLPTHIRTPDGEDMPVFGAALATEVGRRYGAPVEMMQLRHGIFDEASISVIASDTVCEIGRLAGRSFDVQSLDVRRFRPMLWFAYCDRFPSRRTSGWAARFHSARGRTLPPPPSRCATSAARW